MIITAKSFDTNDWLVSIQLKQSVSGTNGLVSIIIYPVNRVIIISAKTYPLALQEDKFYTIDMPSNFHINCRKCQQYYITWDPHFPNGCMLFGFKAKSMPSQTVFEANGKQCEHFEEKVKGAENEKK